MLLDENRLQKILDRKRQKINKLTFMEMNRKKVSIEDNIKNGVKILEYSYKRTNSDFREINNNLDFHSYFNGSQCITLDIIEKKIKEKLGIPLKASIRYDKVKCSKDCKRLHKNHYYFYAYCWNKSIKKMQKKYIGKHLPVPLELISIDKEKLHLLGM